jgi:hypothetical protein
MIRLIDRLAAWPAAARISLAVLLAVAGLFCAGLVMGIAASSLERGALPSKTWVLALPLIAAPLAYALLRASWSLAAPPETATPYERRYWRMWLMIMLLGIPVGLLLGLGGSIEGVKPYEIFTTAPLPPFFALILAALLASLFTVAMLLYHRAIDDHEERAYLWASQVAYYVLVLAFPVWWLLERGGLVGPLTVGWAMIAVLASALVHGGVWAWLKFR